MNILTAIDEEKMLRKIEESKDINIILKDIKYKEGIIEYLEKNRNIDCILINENLNGQIKIEALIEKIKIINNKIKIIIILNKNDLKKEEYLLKNKIKYFYKEDLLENGINEIFNKNKIIGIFGSSGSGKTITTVIISELLIKYYNKKILIIEDNIINNSILNIFKKKENNNSNDIFIIKNNLHILNIKKILNNYKKEPDKIIKKINQIKNNYNYIFIDTQNIKSYKIYEKILSDNILILSANIFEINKIKRYININKNNIKIILNNFNKNSISDKIIKNIFKNKVKIIGKINNNNSYDSIINNNLNINYLNKKGINEFLKIIKKI